MFTFSTSTNDEKDNETLQKPEVSQYVETSCFWFRPTGVKKKSLRDHLVILWDNLCYTMTTTMIISS